MIVTLITFRRQIPQST